jgi:hypothetical protein
MAGGKINDVNEALQYSLHLSRKLYDFLFNFFVYFKGFYL